MSTRDPTTMSDSDVSSNSDAESSDPLLARTSALDGQEGSPYHGLLSIDSSMEEKLVSEPLLPPYLATLEIPKSPINLTTELSTVPEASARGRNLHWSSAYILIISRVIGSGIFATPGVIARSTGSVGLALLLWSLGAIVSACGLAVSLELGCMLPRSGGEKVYLEFIYDHPRFLASTIVAVQAMLLGFTASNCIVFGKYLLFALNIEVTDAAQRICAAGLITVVTLIHGRFLKGGIAIQNVLGFIKIIVIAFMAFSGIAVLIFKPASVVQDMNHWKDNPFSWSHLWQGSEWNFGAVATSFFKVSYAYSGYDNVNNVLDEVRDPVRTLKSAAPAAMVTIFFFYLLLNIAYFVIVPLEDIKRSGELVSALFFERVFGEGIGNRILPVLVALSAAGSVMVTTFAQARVNQEIARQGFLPFSRKLSSSKPFNTPLGGLLVHLIPSLVVILLPPQGAIYSFILELKGYPAQMTSLAVCCGLLWLRKRRPDLRRPFRAWKLAVYLPICLNIALLLAPFFPPSEGKEEFAFWYGTYALVGIGTVVVAVLYWYIWIRLIPKLGGYHMSEELDELDDGTIITQLVKVPDNYREMQVEQA